MPQGSVLAPILFLVYINDLKEYLNYSDLRLFADDSIIYHSVESRDDAELLQRDIDSAIKWEQDWLMNFHPVKCKVLRITKENDPILFDYSMQPRAGAWRVSSQKNT